MQASTMIPNLTIEYKPQITDHRNGCDVVSFPDCGNLTTRDMLYQALSLHIGIHGKRPVSVVVHFGRFVEAAKLIAGVLANPVRANENCKYNEIWTEV